MCPRSASSGSAARPLRPVGRFEGSRPDPASIASRDEFVAALDQLRRHSGDGSGRRVTLQTLATTSGMPVSTVHSYLSGRSLPPPEALESLIEALGGDDDERAGWADALDRIQTTTRRPSVETTARTLSPPLRDFVGRADVLAQMNDQWERSTGRAPLLILTGAGGIGKTSVALEWAHRHADEFPDGALQVDLGGFGQAEPMTTVRAKRLLLAGLGIRTSDVPQDPDDLRAFYQAQLAHRRAVVLLDNARDAASVGRLVTSAPNVTTIVTSRNTLRSLAVTQGVNPIRVPYMSTPEAEQLLVRASGTKPDAGRLDSVARACAGLPLALRLSADSLRTVEEAGEPGAEAGRLAHGRRATVDTVVTSSLQAVSEDARRLFVVLGAIPGRWLDVRAMRVAGATGQYATFDELASVNLLTMSGVGWVRHDLVAEAAASMAEVDPGTPARREALLRYYIAAVRQLLGPQTHQLEAIDLDLPAVEPLSEQEADSLRTRDIDTMVSLMAWGLDTGRDDLVAPLLDALSFDLRDHGDTDPIASTLRRLAANRTSPQRARSLAERALARAARDAGDLDEEIERYERALALLPEDSAHDPSRLAAWCGLAIALDDAGRPDEGRTMLREAIAVAEECGDWVHRSLAQNHLGAMALVDGDPSEALRLVEASVDSAHHASAPELMLLPLHNAARAALVLREQHPEDADAWLQRAASYLDRADTLADTLGGNTNDQFVSLVVHAEVALGSGDHEAASEIAERVDAMADATRVPWMDIDRHGLWAAIDASRGRWRRALEHLEYLRDRAMGTGEHARELLAEIGIARVLTHQGDLVEARRLAAECRERATSMGSRRALAQLAQLEREIAERERLGLSPR